MSADAVPGQDSLISRSRAALHVASLPNSCECVATQPVPPMGITVHIKTNVVVSIALPLSRLAQLNQLGRTLRRERGVLTPQQSQETERDCVVRITCMLLVAALAGAASPGCAQDRCPMPRCGGRQSPCSIEPNYPNPNFDRNMRVRGTEKCKRQPDGSLHSKVYEEQMRGGIPRLGSPQ
jgi:hypothetical protein